MSEQNENGRRFRLYEIILAALLAAFFALLIASGQRTANRVEALDRKMDEKVAALERKVDENTRQIAEVRLLLAETNRAIGEVQNTLQFLVNGLNIRVEPKEQAGPASTLTPNEKLATKDP